MNTTEIAADASNGAAILLAGRTSIHKWWTPLVGHRPTTGANDLRICALALPIGSRGRGWV